MLDIGWSELILIGIVALIVVGPKDLPRMFHALGRMTAKARGMAREFQRAMDDAAKSTGLDEVRKDLNDIRNATSPRAMGIDALENAASKFEKWDPAKGIKAAAVTANPGANPTLAAAPVVTTAAAAVGTTAAAEAATQAALVAAETQAQTLAHGPATAALAEQKAAEQAAARQKALELQAKRTETAAKKFAEKAAAQAAEQARADAEAAAQAPVTAAPQTPAPQAPVTAETEAAAKPARKPPVRRKKSDA